MRVAGRTGSLSGIARLPERQRRELLEAIERRLDEVTRSPSPRALVRLTAMIASLPPADARLGRRLASPAR